MTKGFQLWNKLQAKLPKSWQARFVPGLEQISWHKLLTFYLVRADREDIRMRASFMAFHLMLAIFPAIIFFFTLIAYLPLENADKDLLELIHRLMPENAYKSLASTMEDILSKQRDGLLSIGFLAAIYFSTSAMDSMIRSFHNSLKIKDKRPYYKKKLYSILLNCYFSLILLAALVLITAGDAFLVWMRTHDLLGKGFISYVWQVLNWLVVIILIQLVISSLYRFGPYNRSSWKFLNPGSFLSTILILLMSILISVYVNQFNSYNRIYGSIGTLLVIMLWIYWNSVVTLIGFEFNIYLDQVKRKRLLDKELERRKVGNTLHQ
ncbi:MAG TPA: YihY/virulence factor BrkB family protein [Bacteroidetes bacterium]|nr:YihY/virulence factor BrkB family protein [Bacteroidota bacterium]